MKKIISCAIPEISTIFKEYVTPEIPVPGVPDIPSSIVTENLIPSPETFDTQSNPVTEPEVSSVTTPRRADVRIPIGSSEVVTPPGMVLSSVIGEVSHVYPHLGLYVECHIEVGRQFTTFSYNISSISSESEVVENTLTEPEVLASAPSDNTPDNTTVEIVGLLSGIGRVFPDLGLGVNVWFLAGQQFSTFETIIYRL